MLLKLDGIWIDCILGDRPEERTNPQRIRIDAEFSLPMAAADSDRLEDTLDYVELKTRICEIAKGAKAQMMERLAKTICEATGARMVRVTKFGTVEGLDSVSVEYP